MTFVEHKTDVLNINIGIKLNPTDFQKYDNPEKMCNCQNNSYKLISGLLT